MSKYAKEMAGADTFFRPENVDSYAGRAWDIRISLGDAPVDEAYFFSVDSLADADRPIRDLLEQFALNPERESELDTDEYPDLPFLQEELIQCYSAAKRDQLTLNVFVNHCAEAIDLDRPASDFLAACVFRNKSWDYLVLDLIFETEPPVASDSDRAAFCARYSDLEQTEAIREETHALSAKYEKYGSVSVAPCALGVPDGFDARLQMMEFDGLSAERCALLLVQSEQWLPLSEVFERVLDALAFQTHFSAEILDGLKACGSLFEDA